MKVEEIKPFGKKIDIIVKVLEKNELREVNSKLDDSIHKVTEALVGDETGTILLTLWDDSIEKFETGKAYSIKNAYASLFKSSLRLNIGRYGSFEEAKEEIASIKEENNLSEKEIVLGKK